MEFEKHKVLYLTVIIFPDRAIREEKQSNAGLTIQAGHYEWSFKLQIPVYNKCSPAAGLLDDLSIDGIRSTLRGGGGGMAMVLEEEEEEEGWEQLEIPHM